MHIGYLISSHATYTRPLAHLLASMDGIDPARIRVVSGGHRARAVGAGFVQVEARSFDYTALIDFAQHPDDYPAAWTHVFLLHDTMELGADTDRLVAAADPEPYATAVWGGQCNLALYRADYLRARADSLAALTGCTKRQSIESEGFLWTQLPEGIRASYPGALLELGAARPYGGEERLIERYTGVDLIKYKANYGQNRTMDEARYVVTP